MTANMNGINREFEKLERKKQKLMQSIVSLTEDRYHTHPSPESWSVAQAANHIFLSEQLSLAYLKKKLSYPDTVPPFHIKSWGAVLLIKLVLWTRYKRKAPKAINMWEQQTILSMAELDQQWRILRIELYAFIEKHQLSFGTHLAYNHPFAGRMTMHQMLIFLNDHLEHHLKQVDRIINMNTKVT